MATDIELALMAGRAYYDTRAEINRFSVPGGWTEMRHEAQPSGFEAISFQRGNEIVISFAGTNPSSMVDPDWVANLDLATGLVCAQQLKEAAAYYLEIRKANKK